MSKLWLNTPTTATMAWNIAADLAVKTTILLGLVLVVHLLLGHRRVLFRSGLWNAALVALLVLPAFTLALPRLRVDWLPVRENPTTRVQAGSEDRSVAAIADITIAAANSLSPRSSSLVGSRELARVTGSVSSGRDVHDIAELFCPLLVLAYLSGVLILTLRLIASVSAVGRLKRTALEVDDSFWTEPLGRWRNRLRINRPVNLVQSGRVRAPLVLGWLRPAIVLPVSDEHCDRATEIEVDVLCRKPSNPA
jgi:beta-lactamase regulating signal transducer with metallopeptidase domain